MSYSVNGLSREVCRAALAAGGELNEDGEERILTDAPLASYPLKRGTLYKRSDWVRKWSERVIVINNEAQNFRVDYYTPKGKRVRGHLNLAGYTLLEDEEVVASSGGAATSAGMSSSQSVMSSNVIQLVPKQTSGRLRRLRPIFLKVNTN